MKYIEIWSSNDKENWILLRKLTLANELNMEKLKEISIKFPESSMKYFKIVGQPNTDSTMRVNQLFFF